eukprot:5469152-Pleurochrysis_carterae.AAC.1
MPACKASVPASTADADTPCGGSEGVRAATTGVSRPSRRRFSKRSVVMHARSGGGVAAVGAWSRKRRSRKRRSRKRR